MRRAKRNRVNPIDSRYHSLALIAVSNLFLVGFALDAALSVLDELLVVSFGDRSLTGVRQLVAWLEFPLKAGPLRAGQHSGQQ